MQPETKFLRMRLQGGVGNQLFQFFAGKLFAKETGKTMFYETASLQFGRATHKSSLASMRLEGMFSVPGNRFSREYAIHTILRWLLNQAPKVIGLRITNNLLVRFGIYTQSNFGYEAFPVRHQSIERIEGFFQTWRHINKLVEKGEVKKDELELRSPSLWFTEQLRSAIQSDTLIIHVRRGDYTAIKQFGTLAVEFYTNSIATLLDHGVKWHRAIMFTDSYHAVKDEFRDFLASHDVELVDSSESENDSESLVLMSYGSALIASNSTFAWWAATFGDIRGNMDAVICPEKWFQNLGDPTDLLPENWIRERSVWVERKNLKP